ncbi:MAG: winged helix DNA-binding domain-containing protein, partial [Chloroflexota bacterium]
LTHRWLGRLTRDVCGVGDRGPGCRCAAHDHNQLVVTADDHQSFRPTLQPALEKALRSFFGAAKTEAIDIPALIDRARPFLAEAPRTTGELRDYLVEVTPQHEGDALAYAARTHLPLLQVPPAGTWGSGTRASYVAAVDVLGEPEPPDLRLLLQRYLAAFGPATVMDFQFWTGMTHLKGPIKQMMDDFVVYTDESGTEYLDNPDTPLPDPDTPAPVRFVPEYDNLVIAHKDRTRVLADEDYNKVFLSAARVLPTFLVNGFVAGTWATERQKDSATLVLSPFRPLSAEALTALEAEGEALLRFIEDDANTFELQVQPT